MQDSLTPPTLRHKARGYVATQGIQPWTGAHPTFEARNYHYIPAGSFPGAFLLFLTSIITENAIYAAGAIPHLITVTTIAAIAETHRATKQTYPNPADTTKTQEKPNLRRNHQKHTQKHAPEQQ